MIGGLKSVFADAPEPETPSLPPVTIDTTTLLDLLRNERRRHIITIVAQCEEVTVSDAADMIAPMEVDKPADEIVGAIEAATVGGDADE